MLPRQHAPPQPPGSASINAPSSANHTANSVLHDGKVLLLAAQALMLATVPWMQTNADVSGRAAVAGIAPDFAAGFCSPRNPVPIALFISFATPCSDIGPAATRWTAPALYHSSRLQRIAVPVSPGESAAVAGMPTREPCSVRF